jgi:NADPH:quinone reductase-like Zn-dependent oxidoreductase
MTTATAWAQHERDGKQVLVQEKVQLPSREAHQSLVSVQYVAQNPTDSVFPQPILHPYITNLHI